MRLPAIKYSARRSRTWDGWVVYRGAVPHAVYQGRGARRQAKAYARSLNASGGAQ